MLENGSGLWPDVPVEKLSILHKTVLSVSNIKAMWHTWENRKAKTVTASGEVQKSDTYSNYLQHFILTGWALLNKVIYT